jgi:hypothetical protein
VLITGAAWAWAKQALDMPALIGIGLITAGVIVMNGVLEIRPPLTGAEAAVTFTGSTSAARSAGVCLTPLAAEKPENQTDYDADEHRRADRHIKPEIVALDHDVARQAAQPELSHQRP